MILTKYFNLINLKIFQIYLHMFVRLYAVILFKRHNYEWKKSYEQLQTILN